MTDTADTLYDPRGLIRESYRIPGIGADDCRSIFLDWALGLAAGQDPATAAAALLEHHDPDASHPMTALLKAATAQAATGRRTGRARARREGGQ